KFVIPNDPEGQGAPYICSKLPQFVETKGGAYFFVPSMTALRMIAIGVIDPT
ncbi:MAG: peroxidase, partial [Pseudomonadota bacterium]